MLLDHDVVADGKAKAGTFSGGFCGEEGIEHLFFHFSRNAGAVVADRDCDPVPEVLGSSSKGWLVVASI